MSHSAPAERRANRLVSEQSPYLQQHAYNPVDWYAWGDLAFEAAKTQDKPVFLSIGYATCHWCHVMERESFEDPAVAQLMNDAFVCIKVDREERPEIDSIYMTVCQLLTQSGGWPLTVLLTPERRPFFAGTYFPKQSRFGRVGMLELIPRLSEIWRSRRRDVELSAEEITAELQTQLDHIPGEHVTGSDVDRAVAQFSQQFDSRHGGFGARMKFPTPHNLLFLMRYHARTGDQQAWTMVQRTLTAMRLGGIFDHVGFGFHRYSTDPQWLLPHFEKMLYDQALLTMAYLEAYQLSGSALYRTTVEEIVAYVLRALRDPAGGFYSAEDADSDGVEGKFYVWSEAELRQLLGNDAQLVIDAFHVDARGNFREESTGQPTFENVLHRTGEPQESATAQPPEPLGSRWPALRERLFAQREHRVHPFKDDKILTDWNGLMIAALAQAGRVLKRADYVSAAADAVAFIERELLADDRLLHRHRAGKSGISATLGDYAFLIWGLIELHQATQDARYLERAVSLLQTVNQDFWDDAKGAFFSSAKSGEVQIASIKEFYDGAIPSGNGVMMLNLQRLSQLLARPELAQQAARLGAAGGEPLKRAPVSHALTLCAAEHQLRGPAEIVVSGGESRDRAEALSTIARRYLPHLVAVAYDPLLASEVLGWCHAHTPEQGQLTLFFCQNQRCENPLTSVPALDERLEQEVQPARRSSQAGPS